MKKDIKPEKNLPSTQVMDFEKDAGSGFENADPNSYAIPFLSILQKNSPQCDTDSSEYVKKAEAGDFFNTATREIYSGKTGVIVVPAHFMCVFNEWVPRERGGGFKGSHPVDFLAQTKCVRDDAGKYRLENGNYLVETNNHFLLVLAKTTSEPVVFSLSSTQLKKSRNWMTMMNMFKLPSGRVYPMFSNAYKLTTKTEQNDKGSWKGLIVEHDHLLTEKESGIYFKAKSFKEQVSAGRAKIEEPNKASSDVPF